LKKLERYQEIERSIITNYRKRIWTKFIRGITEFNMIQEGDKIAVCMSGGKDSMLLAKCFQELKKHRKMNFDVVYLVMNPGYNSGAGTFQLSDRAYSSTTFRYPYNSTYYTWDRSVRLYYHHS